MTHNKSYQDEAFELVIGLETHVELSTNSKIFCSCTTAFGGEPNSHCCPGCMAMPGTLPVLNAAVIEYAVKAGMGLNCEINKISKMERKHYFYPDLPSGYQITQFEKPICGEGHVTLSDGSVIRINHIHIEEDAGKLVHKGNDFYVDLNRGCVPLIEIVTEPDFRSGEQVCEYLEKLRLIMRTLGVSDCRMQEGSMRCDVNISVRRKGEEKLGVRAEIKNMNSLSFILKAIEYESKRHIEAILSGEKLIQQTRRYIESINETDAMREKETATDYRYFYEPNLPLVTLTDDFIENIRASLPELPDAKYTRYIQESGIKPKDAALLIRYPGISKYYDKLVEMTAAPILSANVMLSGVFKFLQDETAREEAKGLPPVELLAEAISLVKDGKVANQFLKQIIDKILETGKKFSELFDISDFSELTNDALAAACAEVIAANAKVVASYKSGQEKAIKSLIGSLMRATKGKADPIAAENELKKQML